MNDFDEHELNRLLDSDDDTFQVGDVVRLKHGTRPMDIIYMYPNRRVVKCEYVHSGVIRTAPVVNLVHVRSNQSNNQEETTMSKYGNQSHDQIFEALVEKQFYTVMVQIGASATPLRVSIDLKLEIDDTVIVDNSRGPIRTKDFYLAQVVQVNESKDINARGWVVQKVDTSAHEKRTEAWKTLYEGIKTTEMEKKRAVIANGYEKELAAFAPDAAKILTGFSDQLKLTSAQEAVIEGQVETECSTK